MTKCFSNVFYKQYYPDLLILVLVPFPENFEDFLLLLVFVCVLHRLFPFLVLHIVFVCVFFLQFVFAETFDHEDEDLEKADLFVTPGPNLHLLTSSPVALLEASTKLRDNTTAVDTSGYNNTLFENS